MAEQKKSLFQRLKEGLLGVPKSSKEDSISAASITSGIENIDESHSSVESETSEPDKYPVDVTFETKDGYTMHVKGKVSTEDSQRKFNEVGHAKEFAEKLFVYSKSSDSSVPHVLMSAHAEYLKAKTQNCKFDISVFLREKPKSHFSEFEKLLDSDLLQGMSKTSTCLDIPTQYSLKRDLNSQIFKLVETTATGDRIKREYNNGYEAVNDYLKEIENSIGLKYTETERTYCHAQAKAEALEVVADAYFPTVIKGSEYRKELGERMPYLKDDFFSWQEARNRASEDQKKEMDRDSAYYCEMNNEISQMSPEKINEVSEEKLDKWKSICSLLDRNNSDNKKRIHEEFWDKTTGKKTGSISVGIYDILYTAEKDKVNAYKDMYREKTEQAKIKVEQEKMNNKREELKKILPNIKSTYSRDTR